MLKLVFMKKSTTPIWRSFFAIFPMIFGLMCLSLIAPGQNRQGDEPGKTYNSQQVEVKSYSSSQLLAMSETDFAAAVSVKFKLSDISDPVSEENREEGVSYISFADYMNLENDKKRFILQNKTQYVITLPQTDKSEKGGERISAEPIVDKKSSSGQPSVSPSNANGSRQSSYK